MSQSEYSTPLRTPAQPTPRSRRRALSPNSTPKAPPKKKTETVGPSSSSYSSPYEIIDLNMSEDDYKSKLLEQEKIIGDLRQSVQQLRDEMHNESGLNTSILIETSNRISTQENRVHRRDMKLLEEELDQCRKQMKELKNELTLEMEKCNNLETTLERRKVDLRESEASLKSANQKIDALEQKVIEKEQTRTNLYSEFYNVKIDLKAKIAELDEKCQRYKEMASEEKERNGRLIKEIEMLKAALEESREELNKQLAITQAQLESQHRNDEMMSKSVTKTMSEVSQKTSKALTELKALSTHITNSPAVQQPTRPSRTSDGNASLNKYLADKLMEAESKIRKLEKDLEAAKDESALAKLELSEQKRLYDSIDRDSEKTHKYLHSEISRIMMQKANLRCDYLALERELKQLKAQKGTSDDVKEQIESLEKERDNSLKQVEETKKKLEETENELKKAKDELDVSAGEKSIATGLRNELKLFEEKYSCMAKSLVTVNDQCEQYRNLKIRADESRKRAKDELSANRQKLREMEKKLEKERAIEAELETLRAEAGRLKEKINYLQDELDEAHTYYRDMLAKQAEEISESKQRAMDANSRNTNTIELDRCKLQLSQKDTELRAAVRRANDHKAELEKLQDQLSHVHKQQDEVTQENTRLRRGMTDALSKLEDYKKEVDEARELLQGMEDELGTKEGKLTRLEDQLSDLQDALSEKERLVTYLQSQINVKNVAKVGRRSTLLKTVSEISNRDEKMSVKSEVSLMMEREELEELENEKKKLDSMLFEKKKILQQVRETTAQPSAPSQSLSSSVNSGREPLGMNTLVTNTSASQTDLRIASQQAKASTIAGKGMMRHDIPHRWQDLRHFGVFSRKCAICFMGVPTFGKARRCLHCNIVVHAVCSKRVVNTCGLPDQYGVHFLENNTSVADGRMNGWLKVFRDDCPTKTWQSMWAMLDRMKLVFYDNDAIESNLKLAQPNMKINLASEQWTLKTNVTIPTEGGTPGEHNRLTQNIIQLKLPCYSIFLLAPSVSAATRWIDMLQKVNTKRMMIGQKPGCLSEQLCIMTLPSPNNLAISSVALVDDLLLLCTQTGLFYSTLSGARLPIHVQGISSMTAMLVLPDINCIAMIVGTSRRLCLVPLSSLVKQTKAGTSPAVHPDGLGTIERLNCLHYHKEESNGHRYLCAADPTNIYIFKYNSSKDLFSLIQTLKTREPVICMQSGLGGFYFAADSFYFVPLNGDEPIAARPIASNTGTDYPVAILNTDHDEVLLACQNNGIFCNSSGQDTRNVKIEWEQMPMEFAFTAPYLYIIHYDSIEILQLTSRQDINAESLLSVEREVFACQNAHIVGKQPNGDVYISITSEDRTELHRFNALNKKGTFSKKRAFSFQDLSRDTLLNQSRIKSSSSYHT